MTLRKITSLTALLSFILMLLTSIILYVSPQGKIAHWANWKVWGLGKEEWGAMHTNLGLLFLIASIVHIVLNWKPIMAYLKNKARELKIFTGDFNVALLLTLAITLLTLFQLPPVNAIQDFNESLKTAAAAKYGEPPYGHAEISTLKSFCRRADISLKEALKKLEDAGLGEISPDDTLEEIAGAHGLSPQNVYDLIRTSALETAEKGLPGKPPMGLGRRTLSDICSEYGLEESSILNGLKGLGIDADADDSMRDIAEANEMEPSSVYEAIRQFQTQ